MSFYSKEYPTIGTSNMTLAVTGFNTSIVQGLAKLLGPDDDVVRIESRTEIPTVDRYLFAAGYLLGKNLWVQSDDQVAEAFRVNAAAPIAMCDWIFKHNPKARICVIGSESGFAWGFDGAYAGAKAALHCYVETKPLKPQQQLVCIAPGIIEDSGMTQRRTDHENLDKRRKEHPKHRFLNSMEVARLAYFVLYVDQGYLSNVVIRMNGGDHARAR